MSQKETIHRLIIQGQNLFSLEENPQELLSSYKTSNDEFQDLRPLSKSPPKPSQSFLPDELLLLATSATSTPSCFFYNFNPQKLLLQLQPPATSSKTLDDMWRIIMMNLLPFLLCLDSLLLLDYSACKLSLFRMWFRSC